MRVRPWTWPAPFLLALTSGCASASRDGAPSSAPSNAAPIEKRPSTAATSAEVAAPSALVTASPRGNAEMTPQAIDTARGALTGEAAKWLKDAGFTWICTQRVYPRPPNPHLTWWGWASPEAGASVFEKLRKAFPEASADTKSRTLTFTPVAASRPTLVVSVADIGSLAGTPVYPEGAPICEEPLPKNTKTFVNVSDMPY